MMSGVSQGEDNCALCGKLHKHADGTWIITGAGSFLCCNDVCWREFAARNATRSI